jgi:hypothetical protein
MNFASVVTTINYPTQSLIDLYKKTKDFNTKLYIIGDKKTPKDFKLGDSNYISLDTQLNSNFTLAKILPVGHYSRKNLGYLECIKDGYDCIYETDDDNAPFDNWQVSVLNRKSKVYSNSMNKWLNVYTLFTDEKIWPRGLPLNVISEDFQSPYFLTNRNKDYPIQQGLANIAPDVDAIWRLIFNKTFNFQKNDFISVEKNFWCPFNSQNTWWFKSAFILMYLPSYCSFRMTDIWRSFIAQRCLWEIDSEVLFFGADVYQERNIHDLMRDFSDEIPGYLLNDKICSLLANLDLKKGIEHLDFNLIKCYEELIKNEIFDKDEINLLKCWISDYKEITN